MADLYADRAALAADPTFIARTRNASVRFAMYLSEDANADSGAWALAKSVLAHPEAWINQFATAVSTEPETLSGTPQDPAADTADGDTALQYAIENRVWPAFAASREQALS